MIDPVSRANLRYGWTAVCGFLLLGLFLESLHLIKAPWYLEAHLRRELWTLAHAHGTLLGVVNVAFACTAGGCIAAEATRKRASRLVIWGAALVPLGFFLGGIQNAEGDPSPAIVLVPVGAVLVLLGLLPVALGALRLPKD